MNTTNRRGFLRAAVGKGLVDLVDVTQTSLDEAILCRSQDVPFLFSSIKKTIKY